MFSGGKCDFLLRKHFNLVPHSINTSRQSRYHSYIYAQYLSSDAFNSNTASFQTSPNKDLASANMLVVFPIPGGPVIIIFGIFPSSLITCNLLTVSSLPTISLIYIGRYFSTQGISSFAAFSSEVVVVVVVLLVLLLILQYLTWWYIRAILWVKQTTNFWRQTKTNRKPGKLENRRKLKSRPRPRAHKTRKLYDRLRMNNGEYCRIYGYTLRHTSIHCESRASPSGNASTKSYPPFNTVSFCLHFG